MAKTKARKPVGKYAPAIDHKTVVPIDEIKPDPKNARHHSDRNIESIADSLAAFGQQHPVVCQADGKILAGHGMVQAARSLGWTHLAVWRTDLKGKKATAFQIADNRTGDLSSFILPDLAAQIETIGKLSVPAGFNDAELADLTGVFNVEIVQAPELPAGGKPGLQQITFILSDDQVATVKDAIAKAKAAGPFADTANENSNGNALGRLAEAYVGTS